MEDRGEWVLDRTLQARLIFLLYILSGSITPLRPNVGPTSNIRIAAGILRLNAIQTTARLVAAAPFAAFLVQRHPPNKRTSS